MSESSRQVLVVDGDASARRDVKSACEQDGYQVLDAETGADALRLHTSAHPSLALLEVSLPDGSGYDVCRELRRTDPTTPVIVLSTAHPAKFPETVAAATGMTAPEPQSVQRLAARPERFERIAADTEAAKAFIRAFTAE